LTHHTALAWCRDAGPCCTRLQTTSESEHLWSRFLGWECPNRLFYTMTLPNLFLLTLQEFGHQLLLV
jgi:hypothetical protein